MENQSDKLTALSRTNQITREVLRMERASNSKLTQRQIDRAETDLLINLSTLTQRGLASMVGCHESKISRTDWRFMAAVICAFGMASEISPISRAFQDAFGMLTKQKSPRQGRDSEQQISINF